jgi:ABC-type sulfate/molybdate transport systems ATPase subunit
MRLLQVNGLFKKDERGFELKNISFTQDKFQQIAIAGETGSGKSTLLKIIAGLIQPDKGELLFEQKRILGPADKLVPGHTGIAYLSQHFELPINLRVEQVLEYANLLTDEEAATLYDVCQINHLVKRRTNQLSGGEKQRIAIARLLTTAPRLFLLDEPFSNTDMVHKNMLKGIIRDIGKRLKITCMMISHDPLDTLSWADSLLIMKDGEVIQQGTPQEVYRQPVNEYAGGLLGTYNIIGASMAKILTGQAGSKKLFARPEDLSISTAETEGIKGTVKEIHFFGSYYETAVLIGKYTLTIKTLTAPYTTGATVYVSLLPGSRWYL